MSVLRSFYDGIMPGNQLVEALRVCEVTAVSSVTLGREAHTSEENPAFVILQKGLVLPVPEWCTLESLFHAALLKNKVVVLSHKGIANAYPTALFATARAEVCYYAEAGGCYVLQTQNARFDIILRNQKEKMSWFRRALARVGFSR